MNINSFNIGASSSNPDFIGTYDSSTNLTPTNASNIIQDQNEKTVSTENFGSNYLNYNMIKNEEDTDFDENDVTLEEKMLNDVERLLYNNNAPNGSEYDKFSSGRNNNSHSLPQLPVYTFTNCFKNCASKTMSEQEEISGEASIFDNQSSSESNKSMHSSSTSSLSSFKNQNIKENKESKLNLTIFI